MSNSEQHSAARRPAIAGWRVRLAGLVALGLFAGTAAAAPEIQSWTTTNGARVLFIEAREIPIVDVQLTFDAGAARDGDQPGVARLVADGLMSGSATHDVDELAGVYERYGAEVSTGSARDMGWLRLRSLADDEALWPVVETAAGMLAEPSFPAAEIERLKSRHRTALRQQTQQPGDIAERLFWETVYAGHPYASDPLGTEESLAAIEGSDLHAFHGRYYVGANANLAIVGDLDRAGAERLAEALVGDLPEGQAAAELPSAPELDDDVTLRESFPSTQAHVVVGRAAVARGYGERPALDVANQVFGAGSFTSRLFREVREKRGLVYGVRSRFAPMAAEGPFRIALQTRGDQADEALAVVDEQLAAFLADGPTAQETGLAVDNLRGGFPLRIDSNAGLVGQLGVIGFYDLPLDRLETYPEAIGRVDAGDAHRAFLDAVGHRPRVTIIVGGDRARDGDS